MSTRWMRSLQVKKYGLISNQIAKYEQKKMQELMENKGIIRNKLKIDAGTEFAWYFIIKSSL